MAKKTLPVASTEDKDIGGKESEAKERRYRVEGALRDIERAETHRRDKELMKHVKSLAKEKIRCLGKI